MHIRVIIRLALRNLRRQLRRAVLTAASMVVGGGLLIFSYALGDGSHESWIDAGVRTGSGHVTVEGPEFRLTKRIEDRLPTNVRGEVEQLLASPEMASQVVAVSARLTISGLASSPAGARPVQIMGVQPIDEASFSSFDEQLVEGRYLEDGDDLAAYVGVGLMDSLDLRLGSRLVVQAQDAEQEIAAQLLRVVGVFRSGVPQVDQSVIQIPLHIGSEWLGVGGDVTNVGVVVTDSDTVAGVAARLDNELADFVSRGDAYVMDWRESTPALASAVAIDEFGNHLVWGVLFIIIAFGIMNTVLMSTLHRYREFGVLQALGLTPGQTGAIVLAEGMTLTAVSGFLGVGLGLWLTWYFFGDGLDVSGLIPEDMEFSGVIIDPVIVPLFRVARLAQVFVFILAIGALASVYPAVRAARIDMAEAMKFER